MSQSEIVIYTRVWCGFCTRAKTLLDDKKVRYREVSVDIDADNYKEMLSRSGQARTVPQIFIGELHVGGCDELYALDREGKLDPLLSPYFINEN